MIEGGNIRSKTNRSPPLVVCLFGGKVPSLCEQQISMGRLDPRMMQMNLGTMLSQYGGRSTTPPSATRIRQIFRTENKANQHECGCPPALMRRVRPHDGHQMVRFTSSTKRTSTVSRRQLRHD